MPCHNTTTVVVQDVQNGRTIRWLQWWNIIADSLCNEEEVAEKDAEGYHWIGVQENIGMFSKSQSDRNSLI